MSPRRPAGNAKSPAQARRRQVAREAAGTSDRSASPSRGSRASRQTVSSPSRRDRVLGYGAALGALLGLIGLNIASLTFVVALGYAAMAFLGHPEKRDRRLRQDGWITGVLTLLMAAMVAVVLGLAAFRPAEDDVSLFALLPLGGTTLVLATAATLSLALAAFLAASAFGKPSVEARYRTLSIAAVCALSYFVILLPTIVVSAPAPSPLGSFWSAPLDYAAFFLDVLAAATVASAFLWAAGTSEGEEQRASLRITYAQREYLLFAAALMLASAQIMALLGSDWSVLRTTPDATLSDILAARAAYLTRRLLPLALSVAATAAFWISCRQACWSPGLWLQDTPAGRHPGGRSRSWVVRLFLTWRLPLLYGWLIVLAAACSFLSWYGLLAVLPATASYVWMLRSTNKADGRQSARPEAD